MAQWPAGPSAPHPALRPEPGSSPPVLKASLLPLANNNNLEGEKKKKKAKKCRVYASKPNAAHARSSAERSWGAPARAQLRLRSLRGWMGLCAGLLSDSFCSPSRSAPTASRYRAETIFFSSPPFSFLITLSSLNPRMICAFHTLSVLLLSVRIWILSISQLKTLFFFFFFFLPSCLWFCMKGHC